MTLAEIESVSVVVVPETPESPNQAALEFALHVSVPPEGFLRLISWAAGDVPPAIPEKLSAVGVIEMLGAGVVPVTVRVTGIVV